MDEPGRKYLPVFSVSTLGQLFSIVNALEPVGFGEAPGEMRLGTLK
jgi:hypothetical protein